MTDQPDQLQEFLEEKIVDYAEWRSMNEAGVDLDLNSKLVEAMQAITEYIQQEYVPKAAVVEAKIELLEQIYYDMQIVDENYYVNLEAQLTKPEGDK